MPVTLPVSTAKCTTSASTTRPSLASGPVIGKYPIPPSKRGFSTDSVIYSVEGAYGLYYDAGTLTPFFDGSSFGNPAFGAGLNDDAWHHFAAVNDGTQTVFYIDATLTGTTPETLYDLGSLNRTLNIGSQYGGAAARFDGAIDDFAAWNRALTATEIADTYNKGLAGLSFGPTGDLTDPLLITRTWTATDACGNETSDTQQLTLTLCNQDTDSDGLTDLQERRHRTDPTTTDTDGDGLSDGDEVHTHATDPTNADTDGDGMDDGWELANGTEVFSADATEDPDADGLTNLQESQAGTDPNLADTDGDGFSDGFEVEQAYSDPLVADFDGSRVDVEVINGADITASEGTWGIHATSIYAAELSGYVEYQVTAPSDGHYALEVEATQFDSTASNSGFDLTLTADGQFGGRQILTAGFGVNGAATWILPYFTAGTHTVRLDWRFQPDNGSLRILALRLQSLGGPDNDSNGQADWIDNRNANAFAEEQPPATSLVSPVCYEGNSPLLETLALTNSYVPPTGYHPIPLQQGLLDGWYADVPLSPTNDTIIQVEGNNGTVAFSNTVTWSVFNLLAAPTNAITLREGDALLLNAIPPGATNGAVDIEIGGVTNYTTGIDVAIPHTFDAAGVYSVTGTWTGATTTNAAITVHVVDGGFTASPSVWWGRTRFWDCPDLPGEAVIESDPRMTVSSVALSGDGRRFLLDIDAPERRTILARLGEDGPVLDSAEIIGLENYSAGQIYFELVEAYDDGSSLIESVIVMNEVPDDIEIVLTIFAGGTTFEDGTAQRTLTAADFDENGQALIRFIKPDDGKTSVCHRMHIYQDGVLVGQR